MKINLINKIILVAVLSVIYIPVFALAHEAPVAEGQNTGGATVNSDSAPSPSPTPASTPPPVEGQDRGGGVVSNPGGGGGGGGSTLPPQNTPPPIGGNTSSGTSIITPVSLPVLVNLGQCEYLLSYLKMGKNNPVSEVIKLQTFLRDIEKIDVDITGIFDQRTFGAVEIFQLRYVDDVLRPWGVSTPTGQVYYTTRKKINEIYCKRNFSLTPSQINEIEAYRKSKKDIQIPFVVDVGLKEGDGGDPSNAPLIIYGENETSNSNIVSNNNSGDINVSNREAVEEEKNVRKQAAQVKEAIDEIQVGELDATGSPLKKVWSAIKRIFGR
ncbi:MAG TPA: hypothetical protein VJC02_01810 [Candidatus Paceibacterota bacterium]